MGLLVSFSVDFPVPESTPEPETLGSASTVGVEVATELLLSELWELGCTGVWQEADNRFVAGFEDEPTAKVAVEALRAMRGPVDDSISVAPAPPAEHWSGGGPSSVTVSGASGPITLSIEAGAAFGHGGHPTTRLALDLLTAEISRRHDQGLGTRVLDVGTGTGVLALAASAVGAESVLAIDNDPTAIEVAKANRTRATDSGLLAGSTPPEFDDRPLATVIAGRHGSFDVVVANVLLPVHRALGGDIMASRHGRGTLLTAGCLTEQAEDLRAIYAPLTAAEQLTIDDWVGHRFEAS